MNGIWIKRLALLCLVLAIAGALVYAMLPKPVPVDLAAIDRGPLEVTVDDEGVTRIKDIYQVSAPLSGKVRRSSLHVGDHVEKGESIVAAIQPPDPPFLDVRARRELEATIKAAKAAVELSEAEVRKAQSELNLAVSDLERAEKLSTNKTISVRALEQAQVDVETKRAQVAQADANLELRKRELESAQARLIQPGEVEETPVGGECCVEIRAPVSGVVLKMVAESEQVVAAGAPLIEIGDPSDLEIVVDLLSSDAVRVQPGAEATVESWGGDIAVKAAVRRVEPTGFTKVSALGIEEQRVKTILDLIGDKREWARLGHDFRVFVRIRVWHDEAALRVPLGALFRQGRDWAVFKVVDGIVHLTIVEIGHRNQDHAVVLKGLGEGDQVVLHASDRVADGVAVVERQSE